jgi:hypothetical protein
VLATRHSGARLQAEPSGHRCARRRHRPVARRAAAPAGRLLRLRLRGELEQGRLDIGGAWPLPARWRSSQARLNSSRPQLLGGGAEETSASSLLSSNSGITCPAVPSCPPRRKRSALVALDPGVHEQVAGAAIEAAHGLAGLEVGQVGDAADVEDDPVLQRVAEGRRMKSRHQRRALAAGGMSRLRKSATTVIPASSASSAGLLSCML